MRFAAIVPALNEAATVASVVRALRSYGADPVVVVDGGSRDGTVREATEAGALVLMETRRGYGRACLAGLAALAEAPPEAVVFTDADASDDLTDLPALLDALETADLVVGSRVLGAREGRVETGALTPVQRLGNALASRLVRARWGTAWTDLGPFRVIRWDALQALGMKDETWGWTVEMQARAARAGLRCAEVPVGYRRRRAGESTISGTLSGSIRAGAKILWTIGALALGRR
ncbi:MAG: glycosyltransferase family 2 protein [Bacteroidota bacterium]